MHYSVKCAAVLLIMFTTSVLVCLLAFSLFANHAYAVRTEELGRALHVTPYIKSGDIRQARDLSLVTGLTPNITSYSGFITIDQECDSNLFFWFFPSQNDWLKDPVSLWLNGGPGSASTNGALFENGPYQLSMNGALGVQKYAWTLNSSMIYIDNPVGTGFSYAKSTECYATGQVQIAEQLLNALEQFFELFPELKKNPFFLTGESYAGKYLPSVGYAIHIHNSSINLQGLMVGNPLTDPETQMNYADYLYQLGIADGSLREEMKVVQLSLVSNIRGGDFELARVDYDALFALMMNRTGFLWYQHYLYETGEPFPIIFPFLNDTQTREALHVGNTTLSEGLEVYLALYNDVVRSVKPFLEVLLDKYRVLIYNGQLDILTGYPMCIDFIQNLTWSGAEEYKQASRQKWMVEDRLAGYIKTGGLLTEVLVRNAGHLAIYDQPLWTLDLYNRFIRNQLP